MKYYILNNSTEKNEIGYYPQTGGYYPGYDIQSEKSMVNLKSECFPDFLPDLRFILDKRAKMTDIVKASNINKAKGLLINESTKNLLSTFSLPQSAFYSGFVENKIIKFPYYWFHVISEPLINIDFNKSIFYTTKLAFKKDCIIEVNSDDDLKNKIKDLKQLILAEKLSFKKEFITSNYDIFYFPIIQGYYDFFISERLASAFIKNKTTGISIQEQNIII